MIVHGKVITIHKHKGVQTVVREVEVDGERFLDIRDLIDGEPGRGYLLPLASIGFLQRALEDVGS